MAANSDFIAAAYPEPWQILGVNLRPFSLGHYIKLSRLKCAFVSEKEETATLGDLLLGIIVCSMPTATDFSKDDFWNWLQRKDGGIRYSLYAIKQRILRRQVATPAEYDVFVWGKQNKGIEFASKVKLFSDYIEKHSVAPAYVEHPNDNPKGSGAHWTQTVIQCLTSRCGYTQEEALNAPMSRALADYIKQCESDGAVTILPQEAIV
jgi:hypothetical protein